MKNKRVMITLVILVSVIISIIACSDFNNTKNNSNESVKNEEINISNNHDIEGLTEFLGAIAGVKATDIEVIDNPLGFKGELFAPEEAIKKGVEYYLSHTNNKKMEDLKVDIGDGFLSIYVDYKVNKIIKTPIEVRVNPVLNDNKDLVINIEEVKFLDIKVADWIVNLALNGFINDWFPSDGDLKVELNKGNVVIYKENFKGIKLNELSLEEEGLKINAKIDLRKILS